MKEPETAGQAGEDPTGEFPLNSVDYLFYLLSAIGRLRESQLEPALQILDLNLARHRALEVIGRLGPCTMSELATFTSVDRTTLTRSVDQLLTSGLVERKKDPVDRRLVYVALTEAGQALQTRATAFVVNHGRYLLEGVSETEQREFIRLQRLLVAKLAPDVQAAEQILSFSRRPAAGDGDGD